MNFRHACALGIALGLIGAGGAQAQVMNSDRDGYYLRLEGGWNHVNGVDGNGSPSGFSFNSGE